MNKKYNALIFLLLGYVLLYRLIIYTKFLKFSESITAVFSILLLTISIILFGYRKIIRSEENRKINKIIVYKIVLFLIVCFISGFITGFLKSSYSLKPLGIINNIFFLFVTYSCIELFRYIIISGDKDNKKYIIIFNILLIIFDIILKIRFDTFNGIENSFSFITTVCLPVILNNILLTNLVLLTNSFKSSFIYRLFVELYIYMVPIIPDFNDYIKSLILLLLPFSILLSISKKNNIEEKDNKIKKSDYIFILLVLVLFILIVGIGPFKMLGIETGSMTPNINVGDAVIINKNYDKDKLKEKDIIAYFDDSNRIIVHRIIKVNYDNTFITKGDFNNTADSKYISKDKIYGKVIFRIPYIAYPAIRLRE